MKRVKYRGLALVVLVAIGIAVYLVACKKQKVTPINNKSVIENAYSGYTDEARNVAFRIRKFKSQLVDKEEVMRNEVYMPLDSVVWNVEALFNAEYTFPERKYLETVKQELEFFVDVNADNEVYFGVVADLYDEIIESVRQVYSNDGINTDKSLMAVVVDKGEIVGGRAEIDVCVISGQVDNTNSLKDPVQGPFGPHDCWYYGEYGGTCDDPSVFGDAAEVIEDTINYYYSKTVVPQSGFRGVNFEMFRVVLNGDEYLDENGEPYLYFYYLNEEPPLNLNYELLNYYYNRELEVLMHLLPSDPIYQGEMPSAPAFIEVDIVGLYDYVGNGSCFHHKNYVIYGNRCFIPSQELPPLRDLLN